MKVFIQTAAAIILLFAAGPLAAQWPDPAREMTFFTSMPAFLPWEVRNPELPLAEALAESLSGNLGLKVNLDLRPGGHGILAGNKVTGGQKNGYILGLLESEAAIVRQIQGYTPYHWSELTPVATAWREVKALIIPAELDWNNLAHRPQGAGLPRLAHLGTSPVSGDTLMAMEVAKRAGFVWQLTEVDKLNPQYLLDGRAEAMVMPLAWLPYHPNAGQLKAVLVFSNDQDLPCLKGRPTLSEKNLMISADPPVSFYLPANVHTDIRRKLNEGLNMSLNEHEGLIRSLCLERIEKNFEETPAFVNEQYRLQEAILNQLGFLNKP